MPLPSTGSGYGGLSESLLHFKSGWRFHRRAWVECFLAELKKVPVQKGTLVLRALGSDEQSVIINSRNSLDALGLAIEDGFQCLYGPWHLRKKRATQKVKYLSQVERESECMGVYLFSPPDVVVNEIIIIDDILTTRKTMKAIIKAIRTVLTDVDIKLLYPKHRSALYAEQDCHAGECFLSMGISQGLDHRQRGRC